MKKLIFTLLAVTSVCLLSCSKDKEGDSSNLLIGRWEAVKEVHEPDWEHLDYEYSEGEQVVEFTATTMKSYYEGEFEDECYYKIIDGKIDLLGMTRWDYEVTSNTLKIHEESVDVTPIKFTTIYKRL